MMTADQISELRRLLERYYECLTSPEEEALLLSLLRNPELPGEFAADAELIAAAADAPLREEEIEVPQDLEERILAATCGVRKRKPFSWRRVAAWGAAACVAAAGVAVFFSVGNEGPSLQQLAEHIKVDTTISDTEIIESSAPAVEPQAIEAPLVITPSPQKPKLAKAAPKAEPKAVIIQNGNVREVTDSIEAERLLAEAFALIGSTMAEGNRSLSVADENLAEVTEYLQIANFLLR